MTVFSLALSDFSRLFDTTTDDIPSTCREIIATKDFRYRKLHDGARDRILTTILKRIDSDDMWVSGPDKKDVWEQGWAENLREFSRTRDVSLLTPKFVQRAPILRLDRDYIEPLDERFEFNFVDVYRRWAFNRYLKDVKSIYEFGCGSCQHLPVLAELFPEKALHGLDWASTSLTIIEKLVEEKGWNIAGHVFDLYCPDESQVLGDDDGVYTVGTLEQLGRNFEPFLQFLLRKRPAMVMHFEVICELYDDSYLTDYLALRYHRKRNYLDGYLRRLTELELEGRISILKVHRMFFGSMYHDPYSLTVWKPR